MGGVEATRLSYRCAGATAVLLVMAMTVVCGELPVKGECYIEVGNYWEYVFDFTDQDGVRYQGNLNESVSRTSSTMVGGSLTDVIILDYVGLVDISGSFHGNPITGVATVLKQGTRIASNFSLLSDCGEINEVITILGSTEAASYGWTETFLPPADVYVGDSDISVGMNVESASHVVGGGWFDALGKNSTWTYDNDTTITLLVTDQDVLVTVPAGSFSCYKILITTTYDDGSSDYGWYYYSDLVGNYVKVEGSPQMIGMTDHLLLNSYSYSSDLGPPNAEAGPDSEISVGTTATLNGSASTDDRGIVNFTWTFNDEGAKTLYGATATYKFDRLGLYNVTLTVTDGRGKSDVDYIEIRVIDDIRPTARAGTDMNVTEGDSVALNGSLSSDNIGITNYTWIFMDGSQQEFYGATLNYTFMNTGVYQITLTVRDEAGNSDSDTAVITVKSTISHALTMNASLMIGLGAVAAVAAIAIAVAIAQKRRKPPSVTPAPTQPSPPAI